MARDRLRGGVSGVVRKDVAMTRLPPAPEESAELAPVARLNPRDVQLLRLFATGHSTAQAAAAMSVTTNTVRTRIRRIQDKLAVSGRADAVRLAQQTGIV